MNQNGKDGEGQGHPLPDSEEAREDEIPEHLVREKGHGDDARAPSDPSGEAVAPDGTSYELQRDAQRSRAPHGPAPSGDGAA